MKPAVRRHSYFEERVDWTENSCLWTQTVATSSIVAAAEIVAARADAVPVPRAADAADAPAACARCMSQLHAPFLLVIVSSVAGNNRSSNRLRHLSEGRHDTNTGHNCHTRTVTTVTCMLLSPTVCSFDTVATVGRRRYWIHDCFTFGFGFCCDSYTLKTFFSLWKLHSIEYSFNRDNKWITVYYEFS